METRTILKSLEILTNSEAQAKWVSQPRIILEMALIKLVNMKDELDLEERVRRLEAGYPVQNQSEDRSPKTRPINTDIRKERPRSLAEEKDKPKEDNKKEVIEKPKILDDGKELSLDSIRAEWKNVLQEIKLKKINIYALAIEGEVLHLANNTLTIGYKEGMGFHQQAISTENNKLFVEEVVSKYFNKNININFVINDNHIKFEEVKKDSKKSIEEVVDFFGEEIVEIK